MTFFCGLSDQNSAPSCVRHIFAPNHTPYLTQLSDHNSAPSCVRHTFILQRQGATLLEGPDGTGHEQRSKPNSPRGDDEAHKGNDHAQYDRGTCHRINHAGRREGKKGGNERHRGPERAMVGCSNSFGNAIFLIVWRISWLDIA
jgi:hypothetical protein